MTDVAQRSGNHDTIETGDHSCDHILVAFDERIRSDYSILDVSEGGLEYDKSLVPAMPG
jgi:hypothetical protein